MNEENEEFEIYLRYHKANYKSKRNENKIEVLDMEKIKTIITQLKAQNKYEKVVAIAARKLEGYLNGEDQRFITLNKIMDISILLNRPLCDIFTDEFLEKLK
ncbi:MAG: hypothetical protein K2N57_05345 [Clostridia bacterium]|nr:hypothetical protein [Clostridia bacterium]